MRRFTMDLGPKFDKVLTEMAEAKEISKSEIIRRAVASYAYLNDMRDAGKKLNVIDEQNKTVQEIVLP